MTDDLEKHKQWFAEYVSLGGEQSFDEYQTGVKKFLAIVVEAYVNGVGSRYDAWKKALDTFGQLTSDLYFQSIDNIDPLA